MHPPATGRFDYSRGELITDGAVHVAGIVLGIGAVAALIAGVSPASAPADLVAVTVYGAALVAVLTISAAYNLWPHSPVKWWMRRFDHSAIYVLIAGTYTPVLLKLGDSGPAISLLSGIWIVSVAGILLKIVLPGRFDGLAIALYLLIGWSGIAMWSGIAQLPSLTLRLIVAGGLLYTVGVVFHLWRSLPFQNAIWHAFVLVASGCFYGAVFHAYVSAPPA